MASPAPSPALERGDPAPGPDPTTARLALVASKTTNGVVITDAGGAVQWVNEAFTRISGYSLAEMRGRRPGEVLQGPETDRSTVARISAAVRAGESVDAEILNYARDGHSYWINVKIDPLRDVAGRIEGYIGIQTDVTERRSLTSFQQAILAGAADAIVSTDPRGVVRTFNPAAERLFAVPAAKVVGMVSLPVFFDPLEIARRAAELEAECGEPVAAGLEALVRRPRLTGSPEEREWTVVARGGARVPVRLGLSALRDDENRLLGYLAIVHDVTAQLATERARLEAAQRLRHIAAQVPGMVYQLRLRPDGTTCFPYASEGIKAVYRVAPEDVIDDDARVRALIHPADRARYDESIRDSARTLLTWGEEYRVLFPDGSERWLMGHAHPLRESDGSVVWHGHIRDITARKTREALLHDEELRWQYALESAGDGIWDWDIEDGGLFFSDRWKGLLGHGPCEIGRAFSEWSERVHPDDRAAFLRELHRHLEGETPSYASEHRIRCRDGAYKWVLDRGKVIRRSEDGRPLRAIGTQSDISEKKAAELVLQNSKQQLEAANSSLQRAIARSNELASEATAASRTKSMFLANMSHELRTPLNGVIGLTSLLLDTALSAEQRGFAETVRSSGESLLQIINDILDFSKIEAGRLDLECIDFYLPDVVDECFEVLAVRAQQRGLAFSAVIAPGSLERMRGDPARLRQILLNLAGNALKFTEHGEVVVRLGARPGAEGRVAVECSVSDTGPGIPADRVGQLFQPFTQVDASTTRRFGGSGLGLAITRQLVGAMGGSISLQSRVGAGSTFTFTLDLAPAAPVTAPAGPWHGRRFLLVDPHRPSGEHFAWLGAEAGAICETSPSAAAVLERVSGTGAPPLDLILVAERVPGAEELLSAAAAARAADGRRGIPVLTVALNPGAGALPKPFRRGMLRRVVDAILAPVLVAARVPTGADLPPPVKGHWRILLVEDNPTNQRVALATLNRIGYQAEAVVNGREALAALARQPYDLILMDCQMPEMDGYEATRCIRGPGSPAANPALPIIAMTANALKGDRELCLAAGMDDYLTKPITPRSLAEMLARHLSALAAPVAPPPALDWTNFVRSVGEDEPLARELLEQFTLELPGHLARMRAAGDHEALQRALHSIRNAAENYHAIRLHAAIVAAERSLAAGRDTESGLVDVEVEASVVLAAVSMVAPRRTAGLTRAPLP